MKHKSSFTGCLDAKAFTLIELLVVVLIIGILAAVALPQYQKAVWKSRAAQLMTAASTVGRDATAYKMASGESPTEFAQLSLDYDLPTKRATAGVCGNVVQSTDAQRENDMYQIVLNNTGTFHGINSAFITGPYQCAGFMYLIEDHTEDGVTLKGGNLYCAEVAHQNFHPVTPAGKFCEKIMRATLVKSGSWRYYELP